MIRNAKKIQELRDQADRKYIYRTDYERWEGRHLIASLHGYRVEIPLKGKRIRKWFGDPTYSLRALSAARAWRDVMLDILDLPLIPTTLFTKIYNKTGQAFIYKDIAYKKYVNKDGSISIYKTPRLSLHLSYPSFTNIKPSIKARSRSLNIHSEKKILTEFTYLIQEHEMKYFGQILTREVCIRQKALKRKHKSKT